MRWNEEHVLTAQGLDGIALRYSLLYGPATPSSTGCVSASFPSCATPGAAVSQHLRRSASTRRLVLFVPVAEVGCRIGPRYPIGAEVEAVTGRAPPLGWKTGTARWR
jgi:hypothetical protein